MTWIEDICDSVMVKMELAAVAVEMSVPQTLKLHLSYVKVLVAVVAGADDNILWPCFEFC